jgi:hypothetical protein
VHRSRHGNLLAVFDARAEPSAENELAPHAAASVDANAAADLNACTRARDFGEACAILRARIVPDWMQRARLWRFFRRLTGLLSDCDPSRQHRNNDRKDDYSHRFFYRV